MKRTRQVIIASTLLVALAGCDPNGKAKHSQESGLPTNCRAYVQVSIDGYRNKKYTADEVVAGLERNCGANGQLWSN